MVGCEIGCFVGEFVGEGRVSERGRFRVVVMSGGMGLRSDVVEVAEGYGWMELKVEEGRIICAVG